MLPSGPFVSLLILAVVPGWMYLRLRERISSQPDRSALGELLEVAAVGVATTGIAAAAIALVPHSWLPFALDVNAWAARGNHYLRGHPKNAVFTGLLVLALAIAIALGLHRFQKRRLPMDRFRPAGNVWTYALGQRPRGKVPWVGLQLRDGRLIEGLLHTIPLGPSATSDRDIALQRPLRITDADQLSPRDLDIDRIVVPNADIASIAVIHVPERTDRV